MVSDTIQKVWSEEEKQQVWEKGKVVQGSDPKHVRKDECGAWIWRDQHGNRKHLYGWEIDHINPDGGDGLSNLRPLQWENNASRQDGRFTCPVKASGTKNIHAK